MPTIDGGEGEGGVEEAGLGLDSREVLQQAEQSFSSKLTVFESVFNSRLIYSCGYSAWTRTSLIRTLIFIAFANNYYVEITSPIENILSGFIKTIIMHTFH